MITDTNDQTITSDPVHLVEVQEKLAKVQEVAERLGGVRSGRIPEPELIAVSDRVCDLRYRFVEENFPDGKLTRSGFYWETAYGDQILRISLAVLSFWDNRSSRIPVKGSNALTLWMIAKGYPLDENYRCRDGKLLRKAVRDLNRWCDQVENGEESESIPSDGIDYETECKGILYLTLLRQGACKGTARNLHKRIVKEAEAFGVSLNVHIQLSSSWRLRDLLILWARNGENEFFSVKSVKHSGKQYFTLTPTVDQDTVLSRCA
jgi:hypothetical protein